jgi:hypothetical protein
MTIYFRLCNAAVDFLVEQSMKRAKFIARSSLLYEKLGSITLERLSCRRDFMTFLVIVKSHLNTEQEKSQMQEMVPFYSIVYSAY